MARRLFSVLSPMSLLMCVATVTLWFRSEFVADELLWNRLSPHRSWDATCNYGLFIFQPSPWPAGAPPGWAHYAYPPSILLETYGGDFLSRHGFSICFSTTGFPHIIDATASPIIVETTTGVDGDGLLSSLTFPLWAPVLLFVLLPGAWLIMFFKRSPPSGRCSKCGYDLRATPDRCPECGTIKAASR
jgi:hypothetical protein